MERYEINKYLLEFEQKVKDLADSLDVTHNRELLLSLNKQIEAPEFWNDQENAKKVISEANQIRDKVSKYDDAFNNLESIKELDQMSLTDSEALELLSEEIIAFSSKLEEVTISVILNGKYDNFNAILEFHPGAGGTESMDWALMLYRMYLRYSEQKGFKFSVLDYQDGEDAGIKSATVLIKGPYAYGLLKSERGVHRLVRISPFDSNKRRHTSFASIDVAPQIEESNEIIINDEDIKVDVYHSSGAGGQSVNTTDSAVRITHKATGIVVTCQNERSQIKNREVALKVLKSKLLELEIRKQEEELRKIKGNQMDIGFGSQIRSYVFCPYTLVKDHRTNYEMGNINAVMDGDIEGFIRSYLKMNANIK